MHLNKRGVALLQVLIISAILAGLSAMILRTTLSRQVAARRTRREVKAQMVIEYAMAYMNNLWALKTPEAYAEDLHNCKIVCAHNNGEPDDCHAQDLYFNRSDLTINVPNADDVNTPYRVQVTFAPCDGDDTSCQSGSCQVTYTILNGDKL